MTYPGQLSKRETEVAELLLQGKSNKQIALALGISDHTVEFHLKNVYAKLHVGSRAEAILKLGKFIGGKLGESVVDEKGEAADNQASAGSSQPEIPAPAKETSLATMGRFLRKYTIPVSVGTLIVIILTVVFYKPPAWGKYERECENSDEATMGQSIWRSKASGQRVYGQFGTASEAPWPAKAGYVIYKNISTPQIDRLFLKIRYSKNSPTTVPVLIFVDNEPDARASFYPQDQQNWDVFTWTDPMFLGEIGSGVHSIKFATEGEQYGVADLDKLILTR